MRYLRTVSATCAFLLAACGVQEGSEYRALAQEAAVGESLALCESCPEFVAVPNPPHGLRNIRYVAKFELSWSEYFAAVDAGSCPAPRKENYGDTDPQDIGKFSKYLRIDWPIGQLGEPEIECYSEWLGSYSQRYSVELPSANEWLWFAQAGDESKKFGWGVDPNGGREALRDVEINPADEFPPIAYERGGRFVVGVKRGLFQPNPWGIHDLTGNLREVVSDRVEGEKFARENPDSKFAQRTKNFDRAVLMGNSRYDPDWETYGLARRGTALIGNGQFSTDVAIRLVLIEGGE